MSRKATRDTRNPDIVRDGTEQDQIAASVAAGEAAARRDIELPPSVMSISQMDEYFSRIRDQMSQTVADRLERKITERLTTQFDAKLETERAKFET